MKVRTIYFVFIVLFLLAVAFILIRFRKHEADKANTTYILQERKGMQRKTAEWKSVRSRYESLIETLKKNPRDTKSALGLALLFIQEARITGNFVYYDVAAMKSVDDVLKIDPENFDALLYKALIYLSQHHFADGLAIAEKAKNINPYNAFVYGMLVDGNVEMGNYDSAVAMSDKMVSIRPDLRSYSRISYLREIYGDYPGAIRAMKLAVDAGAPGDESTEWSRIQLGHLYERTGDSRSAEMQYTIALQERPAYPYGLAGLARVEVARKNYTKALEYYNQADTLMNDYALKEELAETFVEMGNQSKADSVCKLVVSGLATDAVKGQNDQNVGHYADRELAYAYLKVNNNDKALEHALLEYNRRPENIDVNEALAWVYYKKSDIASAKKYITIALKTKCKNPVLLTRAALIYNKAGDATLAKSLYQESLQGQPFINKDLRDEGVKDLK